MALFTACLALIRGENSKVKQSRLHHVYHDYIYGASGQIKMVDEKGRHRRIINQSPSLTLELPWAT